MLARICRRRDCILPPCRPLLSSRKFSLRSGVFTELPCPAKGSAPAGNKKTRAAMGPRLSSAPDQGLAVNLGIGAFAGQDAAEAARLIQREHDQRQIVVTRQRNG